MLDRIKRNFHSEGIRELTVRVCICLVAGILYEYLRKKGGTENIACVVACGFILVIIGFRVVTGRCKKL